MPWQCSPCSVCIPHLQGGALVGEGGAEEGGDDAHDDLGHVLLQDGVCVLPVAGVVAGLQHKPQQGQGSSPETGVPHFTLSWSQQCSDTGALHLQPTREQSQSCSWFGVLAQSTAGGGRKPQCLGGRQEQDGEH